MEVTICRAYSLCSTRSIGWTVDASPWTAVSKGAEIVPMGRAGIFNAAVVAVSVERTKRSGELTLVMIAMWLHGLRGAVSPFSLSFLEGIVECRGGGLFFQRRDWF